MVHVAIRLRRPRSSQKNVCHPWGPHQTRVGFLCHHSLFWELFILFSIIYMDALSLQTIKLIIYSAKYSAYVNNSTMLSIFIIITMIEKSDFCCVSHYCVCYSWKAMRPEWRFAIKSLCINRREYICVKGKFQKNIIPCLS